jgi:DnaJ-class molecular chaperone
MFSVRTCQRVMRQTRCSSSTSSDNNPYTILGVSVGSDYVTVKRAFLSAALLHHPDTTTTSTREVSTADSFVRIRQAFELIVKNDSSRNTSMKKGSDDDDPWTTDCDLKPFLRQSTSEFLCFDMDDATRNEVIKAFRTLSRGGRGGYWDMAQHLSERDELEQEQKTQQPVLELSMGNTVTRRKRKMR